MHDKKKDTFFENIYYILKFLSGGKYKILNTFLFHFL